MGVLHVLSVLPPLLFLCLPWGGRRAARQQPPRQPLGHPGHHALTCPAARTNPPCRGPGEALDSWSGNIGRLLVLVEKTCQQIQKESMVHRVPIGAA